MQMKQNIQHSYFKKNPVISKLAQFGEGLFELAQTKQNTF